jgi:hypothetical protein
LENNVKQNHVNNYCSFCPYDINWPSPQFYAPVKTDILLPQWLMNPKCLTLTPSFLQFLSQCHCFLLILPDFKSISQWLIRWKSPIINYLITEGDSSFKLIPHNLYLCEN